MESSQICLFHFLWYNGHRKRQLASVVGKRLSHNFLDLKGAFLHWMAFFNCYFLTSAIMATTKAAKLMMTIKA